MGRSKNACFRILSCTGGGGGGGGTYSPCDGDDGRSDESKAISDKSRWSFRRGSTRHRVLRNNEISEPETVNSNKEISDVVTNSFYLPKCSAPEKTLEQENPNQDAFSDSAGVHSEAVKYMVAPEMKGSSSDQNHLYAAAVIIQAGIRAYLARRELSKLKSIVELQASIRGDLVRREAVATLLCLNGIIKMQALVLTCRSKQLVEKFSLQNDKTFQVKGRSRMQQITKPARQKLLVNAFVRQIMAIRRMRVADIKCDPSKSGSAWTWLERWTTITSCNIRQSLEQESNELAGKKVLHEAPCGDDTLTYYSYIMASELDPTDSKGMVGGENSVSLELHAPVCAPDNSSGTMVKANRELESLEMESAGITWNIWKTETVSEKAALQTDAPKDSISLLDEAQSCGSALKNASKIEPLEDEGKKCATQKPCNPAFAAAKLKFQELSSNSTVNNMSTNSSFSCSDGVSKIRSSGLHSHADVLTKVNNDLCPLKNPEIHDTRVQNAASECGTEISISSTLDSPDRSETESGEIVLEIGSFEKRDYDNSGGAENDMGLVDAFAGLKNSSVESETQQLKRLEEDENTGLDPVLVEQQAEAAAFKAQDELEKSLESQGRPSPEGTPGSCITVTESHGTPSSQTSMNTKRNKKDGGMLTQRRKLNTLSKSLSSPNSDPVGRNSIENLPQDMKNTKRVAKFDPADHEPRVSNSHPLPSYMQATESVRAKVHASISPKLSPDIHDNHLQKRHSLATGNGEQDSSPRMQRLTSQAQQNSKGNGTAHNSAERRWQI